MALQNSVKKERADMYISNYLEIKSKIEFYDYVVYHYYIPMDYMDLMALLTLQKIELKNAEIIFSSEAQ